MKMKFPPYSSEYVFHKFSASLSLPHGAGTRVEKLMCATSVGQVINSSFDRSKRIVSFHHVHRCLSREQMTQEDDTVSQEEEQEEGVAKCVHW